MNEPTIVDGENTTPPATVTVNMPAGYYDVEDINNLLHNTMTTNLHYYQRFYNKLCQSSLSDEGNLYINARLIHNFYMFVVENNLFFYYYRHLYFSFYNIIII